MADTSSSIELQLNGVNNTEKTIEGVKKDLEGLNETVEQGGTVAKKATSLASAGMSAFNGTLSGAVAGARGMASAIEGMGVSIGTAMPIAAALAAALYGIKKAYDAVQKSRRDNIELLKTELKLQGKHADEAKSVADEFTAVAKERNKQDERNAKLQGFLTGVFETPVEEAARNLEAGKRIQDAIESARDRLKQEMDAIDAQIEEKMKEVDRKKPEFDALSGVDTEVDYYKESEKKEILDAANELNEKRIELRKKRELLLGELSAQKEEVKMLQAKFQYVQNEEQRMAAEERDRKIQEGMERARKLQEAADEFNEGQKAIMEKFRNDIDNFGRSLLQSDLSGGRLSGAKQTSREEVAKIAALAASGAIKATATGWSTTVGDNQREEYYKQKTAAYQDEVTRYLRSIEKKVDVQEDGLGVQIMSI